MCTEEGLCFPFQSGCRIGAFTGVGRTSRLSPPALRRAITGLPVKSVKSAGLCIKQLLPGPPGQGVGQQVGAPAASELSL